jgi:uncharacterized protein (TIGR03118 family)
MKRRYSTLAALAVLAVSLPSPRLSAGGSVQFEQIDLVSDIPGLAAHTDPNLVNPWGIASSATSPFWVANNGTGLSTLYNSGGTPQALVVTIPSASGPNTPSAPSGVVFSGGSSFEITPGRPARFLFATEDGTISGWNPGADATHALLQVNNSAAGAVYKGLATGNNGSGDFLYAANFSQGKIEVFDGNFQPATLSGNFTDPNLPSGFAPFNVQNLNGKLYVTFAKLDAQGKDDAAGAGNGFVSVFDLNGNLERRLVSNGPLNSPWGLAIAPSTFGEFAGSLLVGNFGDGTINGFDPFTGNSIGALAGTGGNPIKVDGLWGLIPGNGGNGGDPNKLYFTAGIAGNDSVEDHGLLGSLSPVGSPSSVQDTSMPMWLVAATFFGLIGCHHRLARRQEAGC